MAEDDEIARAEVEQRAIAARVEIPRGPVAAPRTVAGLDVSYATGSDRVVAAAVVVDIATGAVEAEATVDDVVTFPYLPGLLAFREVPVLTAVLARLTVTPVSPGHRVGVAQATGIVLGIAARYRVPDPIRRADHLSRRVLRG